MYQLTQIHFQGVQTTISNDECVGVISGKLYSELASAINQPVNISYVTLTMNTDGIPVFHSSGH